MRGRILLVVLTVTICIVAAGTAVLAAGGDAARQRAIQVPRVTGSSNGGGCAMGFDTQNNTLIPPDDSTSNNAPAGAVTVKKSCAGAVVGQFTGEISTPLAGDFIHMDMRATCTGTGGFANPCTVGQQVFASPGHSFVQSAQTTVQARALNMVWAELARGRWRFEVLPGGNNNANIQFRTFTVEAFAN